MNKLIFFAMFLVIISCSDSGYVQTEESKKILKLLEANDFRYINFSEYGGNDWSKVCFLGPYNEQSEEILGFSWYISEHTNVLKSDGHNVIVFAVNDRVIEYIVHSRVYGDFWKLSGKCYPRESSQFINEKETGNWGNYVHKPCPQKWC